MTLSEEAHSRLADVVELQPTKNSELQDRWGMDSGSDVHSYLTGQLADYTFRDDNSLIRATSEAADLVDVEPGVEPGEDGDGVGTVRVTALQADVIEVLPGPDERSKSVVAVLQALREHTDRDPEVDEVRSALQRLRRQEAVEVEYRSVPTFRLAVPREDLTVEIKD
ncbi:hypothetical protein L593_12605 [Salinarchaeum sp. Harcht-Bsk1]|uniref:DUF5797 family protein n=1 Tax=Salinarchaeum sp. Harcht-Bsk1 TaxID=1333523 RepID=UPI0003423D91|nr:DUF5797 family protein [Salinarchaeum sp. Harcht-Bsk1]AGN02460.1 hypothetical protein L593_12605 [Salinarchaeum sp. Harcht-Bsk1]